MKKIKYYFKGLLYLLMVKLQDMFVRAKLNRFRSTNVQIINEASWRRGSYLR